MGIIQPRATSRVSGHTEEVGTKVSQQGGSFKERPSHVEGSVLMLVWGGHTLRERMSLFGEPCSLSQATGSGYPSLKMASP